MVELKKISRFEWVAFDSEKEIGKILSSEGLIGNISNDVLEQFENVSKLPGVCGNFHYL